jgi:hypothetical protein
MWRYSIVYLFLLATVLLAGKSSFADAETNAGTPASFGSNTVTVTESFASAVDYLQAKTVEMLRANRNTMSNGVTAFPPQVGAGYNAFWLRDYAYMLEGGASELTPEELTRACDVFIQGMRADGAGVDCVKYNGNPIYKPGFGSMGENPVADGSQFTVDVAWWTFQRTRDEAHLSRIIDSLVKTMNAVPRNASNGLVRIRPGGYDRCPYGFTDTVRKQGDELFCSLLYVQASRQLAELFDALHRSDESARWHAESVRVSESVRRVFWDAGTGLFLAATDRCRQPDIWGSAFAVWLGVATLEQSATIANYFKAHYAEIVQAGQIRHLPGGVYWEESCPRDTYQNGGYWATATGWFAYTLYLADPNLARETFVSLVKDFQSHGVNEWILGSAIGVPRYLSSVTLPLAGARRIQELEKSGLGLVHGPFAPTPSQQGCTLTVIASGYGPARFQWRRDGLPLTESSIQVYNTPMGGATLSMMVALPGTADAAMAGLYDVIVTRATGAVTSAPVRVERTIP